MPLSRWLRQHAEHQLLVFAQDRVGRQYGGARPRPPHRPGELFWQRVFAPAYQRVPWSLRRRVLWAMPGSHRQQWTSWSHPPGRRPPGV